MAKHTRSALNPALMAADIAVLARAEQAEKMFDLSGLREDATRRFWNLYERQTWGRGA